MRRLIGSVVGAGVVTVALALTPVMVNGQALAMGSQERGPRFLLATASKVVPVDVSKTPVLARRLSLDLGGATLKDALAEITGQSGFRLAYSDDDVPLNKRVHLRAEAITAAAALTDVLLDTGLDVVFRADGSAALVKRPPPAQEGTIVGRVADRQSGQGLGDALVTVEGTSLRAGTGPNGSYRISSVPLGAYTVSVRRIGYARQVRRVVVAADQEVRADFVLEQAATRLDELVTVTPGGMQTELRAVPSPVTVITAEEIKARQPQTINDVFRQLVPSAVGFQPPTIPAQTALSVRGASTLSGPSGTKIFIDGIETSSRFVSPIDPLSIERIEVVRGPEAATLYGPDAAGGVIQIFTKHGGVSPRPEVRLTAQTGIVQTPYAGYGSVPRQQLDGEVRGGGENAGYNLGASFSHLADWIPGGARTSQSVPSGYGGLRYAQGIVTAEVKARYLQTGASAEANPELLASGFLPLSRPQFLRNDTRNETYGAALRVTPFTWWQNQVTIGVDRSTVDSKQDARRLTTPADTLFVYTSLRDAKLSLQLNTSLTRALGASLNSSLTAGVDYYHADQAVALLVGALNTTGELQPGPGAITSISTSTIENAGYFAQGQLEWRRNLFLTAGLRADDNSSFGADVGTPIQPRVGLTAVTEAGDMTIKVRGAYGRAIRAPAAGLAAGFVGPFSARIANPALRPERQRGWDAGIDLLFGSRGSLSLTGYRQIAEDLIVSLFVTASPVFTTQFRNIGRVANSGLEVEGSLDLSPIHVRAQYAYTKSRIEELGPDGLPGLEVGGRPLLTPVHTAGGEISTAPWSGASVGFGFTYVGGWRNTDTFALFSCFGGTGPCPDPPIPSNFTIEYPSFVKLNLNVIQRVTPQVDALLSINNLNNNTAYESDNLFPTVGRTTMVGLRARL